MANRDIKGRFLKGHRLNDGRPRPDVSIRNISSNAPRNTGRTRFKKGSKINFGRKHSNKTKKKFSTIWRKKYASGYINPTKGKPRPHQTGENNPSWKGGTTSMVMKIRNSPRYYKWRSDVFERDNWTCQTCGDRGCVLNAHHIIQFSSIFHQYKIRTMVQAEKCDKLWDVSNGVTLCLPCHNLTKGRPKKSGNI